MPIHHFGTDITSVHHDGLMVDAVHLGLEKVWPPAGQSLSSGAHAISDSTATAAVTSAVETQFGNYFAFAPSMSRSRANAYISNYSNIYARSFSSTAADSTTVGAILGQTTVTTPTTYSQWFDVPIWAEAMDVIAVGAGSGGNGYAGIQEGAGGGAGQWSTAQIIFRNLLTAAGLTRANYSIQYRYQVGAGGPAGQLGKNSIMEFQAVPLGGGQPVSLTSGTVTAKGGDKTVSNSLSPGGSVTPNSVSLSDNAISATGGVGGIDGANGTFPGGGGGGQRVFIIGATGAGANGALWWRLHSGSKLSQYAFSAPTTPGVWQSISIPLDTVEIDFAGIGGGGGGGGGALVASGVGGVGGTWAGTVGADGLNLRSLYANAGVNSASVEKVVFEYQVGAGGISGIGNALGFVQAAGDGQASRFRLRALAAGVWYDLVREIVAPGGKGQSMPDLAIAGGNPTGGDTNNGRDKRIRVLGRTTTLVGGNGAALTLAGQIGASGESPGGGGGGGSFPGLDGGRGGSGAVFLTFGAVEAIRKVQVIECMGTKDDSYSSFASRHIDHKLFEHTIVKGYPNTLLPFPVDPAPWATNLSISVAGGVQQVMKEINALPSGSSFVLMGTSQGAQIMGTVWNDYIRNNPALASRCKRVYLMGNPIREAGRAFPGCNPIPTGNGIATADLRLKGTTDVVWEFANHGDPVATNTNPAIEAAFATMWIMSSLIDLLALGLNVFGVVEMMLGMNEAHNYYGYNAESTPVDMSNPYRPIAGDSRPGWKIIVDDLNKVVGPAAMYRGTFMPDGTFREEVREYAEAVFEVASAADAEIEIL